MNKGNMPPLMKFSMVEENKSANEIRSSSNKSGTKQKSYSTANGKHPESLH